MPRPHNWAREIGALGHDIRLVPPAYVKPFVKRQKNDAADAEAIAEAASRPTMRFVEPKSPRQQARAMAFRTRDLFVRQRTQTINALRAHLAEHGLIAPPGLSNLAGLQCLVEDSATDLDPLVVETARIPYFTSHLTGLAALQKFTHRLLTDGWSKLTA